MTPVEFHFITPAGQPIVSAEVEIQISQAGYDAITPGILMPRLLTVTTDAEGKAMISLVSSDIMYYVIATDSESDVALFYKFIVPPLAYGVVFVRLQDILVEGPLPQVPYDEAALLTILTAKANVMTASVGVGESADLAAASAAAALASETSAAAILSDVAIAAVSVPAQAAAAEVSRDAAAASATAAGNSATAAATSQTDAAASATASTTKADEASTSATAAAASETSATASAATATTQAGNASTFATAAAGSSATATTQAGIAVTNAGLTAADSVQTGLDRVATAADRVQTGLDRVQTVADHAATSADRAQTTLDAATTAADRLVTAADKAQTISDAAATAADRVQTGLDRTAAAASAVTASTGAGTATTKAAEAVSSAADAAASAALAASTVTGVNTVNGRSGAITLTSADVGLSNANNTSDANKPVSTAQATADTAVQTAAATDATTKANAAQTAAATDATTKADAAQAAAIAASTPVAHVGTGGGAHANVVAAGAAGFMSGADKTKLDAVSGTNTGDETGARIAALNHAATLKAVLVGADEIVGGDSASGFGLIRTTLTNLVTFLGATFAKLAGNTFTGAQIYSDQVLSRGMTKDMGLVFLDKGNSGTAAQTCDYTAGSHQKLTVTGAFVMNAVTNWPPTGNTGELLLELVNGASSAITWTMAGTTQKWWKADGTAASTIGASGVSLQTSGTDWILLWSTDGGTTTNLKVMR